LRAGVLAHRAAHLFVAFVLLRLTNPAAAQQQINAICVAAQSSPDQH